MAVTTIYTCDNCKEQIEPHTKGFNPLRTQGIIHFSSMKRHSYDDIIQLCKMCEKIFILSLESFIKRWKL